MNELEKNLYENIGKIFNKDFNSLSRETRFTDDLRARSQSMYAVAAVLEKLCGSKVTYADVCTLKTLGDALDFIENK